MQAVTWELADAFKSPVSAFAGLTRALAGWARLGRMDRRQLARACMNTGGARFGAFLRGPDLLHQTRRGDVNAITAYSFKHHGLATYLAEIVGNTHPDQLSQGTQYFGEFAFELLAVIPYAYWLHKQGKLAFTTASADTRALYYFSPNHEERMVARKYVPITEWPIGEPGRLRYDRKAFPSELDTSHWEPPPYRSVFRDSRFEWARETCIVCNKYSDEQYLWYRGPANFIDTETLLALIGRLRSRYQVIYVRPRGSDIVNDHQQIHEYDDIDAVTSAFPDVVTIQKLRCAHPDLSFNELQLRLFAGCERFVSVLGGSSYLASYFGGTNVVYARRGWEVACGAYDSWFHRFSGARVVSAASPEDLLAAVDAELLTRAASSTAGAGAGN